jgi:hypothetical protein
MPDMTACPNRLFAGFNGRHVEIECHSDQIASQVRLRLNHLLAEPPPGTRATLRLTLSEPSASWVELHDSAGRCVRGSLEYVLYFVRKWTTADFAAGHPDLLWVHAGAAAWQGVALLLPGPAGSGKSTFVVRLLERGWRLFADDAVPVDADRGMAMPLPFTPDVRTAPCAAGGDTQALVELPKHLVPVAAADVAPEPASIGAIVFPEYDPAGGARPALAPLSTVAAAEALATSASCPDGSRRRLVGEVFRLAERVPCYRLHYRDATAAAAELALRWPLSPRRPD